MAKVEFHPDMAALGERIRLLREMKGWTQGDLERESGVEQSSISNYESGKRAGVPLANIMRIADALGSPIQFLAYGREWKKPESSSGLNAKG